MTQETASPRSLQHALSVTLRSGVLIAATIGLMGGALFLLWHGSETVTFGTFRGVDTPFTSGTKVMQALHSSDNGTRCLAIVQLGIFTLLLTPIARVALSIVGFALARDYTYVAITAVVLLTLLVSAFLL